MRSMVEGAPGHCDDPLSYGISILQNRHGRNTDEAIALRAKDLLAPLVILRAIAGIVCGAVDLHDKARSGTIEIHHVWIDGVLPAESDTLRSAPEPLPQQNLRLAHLPTKLAGAVDGRASERAAPSVSRFAAATSPSRGG